MARSVRGTIRLSSMISYPSPTAASLIPYLSHAHARTYSTPSPPSTSTPPPRQQNKYANNTSKAGGDISDAFASLAGAVPSELPPRYSALKQRLVPDENARKEVLDVWGEVLGEVRGIVEAIKAEGGKIIPQIEFEHLTSGKLSSDELDRIKSVGTVIVKNAVPKEEALGWKASIQEYAKINEGLTTGFPPENPQVWEFYHSKPQLQARLHPNVLATQAFLLKLWHASPDAGVDFETPISYFDRLRIRWPGDAKFALGPHIDGGSVERWEDPTYFKCFDRLLTSRWREHDSFDGTNRIGATMDMYKGQGACNIFRPWQGWLSMSTTRANEGTLRVFPNLRASSAYLILRPFFRAVKSLEALGGDKEAYLAPENWALDLGGSRFPGSVPGRGQELDEGTHPHLELGETMTSLPLVEPGDQVYWHCDVIHAVESRNAGKGDSSVMYIPAAPLTVNNAEYLAAQRTAFLEGYKPFDFSGGGDGEARFKNRATRADIHPSVIAQRAMGFEGFVAPEGASEAQVKLVGEANQWLGLGEA